LKEGSRLPEWAAADCYLDVSGSLCPEPVIKAKAQLNSMRPGDVLEIHASDPLAELDLAVMCDHLGHLLLQSGTFDGLVRVQIRRAWWDGRAWHRSSRSMPICAL